MLLVNKVPLNKAIQKLTMGDIMCYLAVAMKSDVVPRLWQW
jgi:hypothetical protein